MCEKFAPSISTFTFSLTARKPSHVLLTTSHDGARGLDLDPFIAPRRRGPRAQVMGLWPITRDIVQASGANVVCGLLPRRFIDYDLPAELAYESHELAVAHQDFHGKVFEQVRQMVQRFGAEHVLVIDVDALVRQPAYAGRADSFDLIISSGNRATIRTGSHPDREFEQFLTARGYNVFAADNSRAQKLFDRLAPGFTIAQVARELGISAFKIEIARRFRVRDAAVVGTRLSSDIAEFLVANFGR